jgi:membrane fusion protein YbhG
MKKKLLVIAAVLIGVSAIFYFVSHRSTLDANVIRVSGNIEVIDAEVSFKIPGRVEKRLVTEGETVKSGQLIAKLDSAELAQEVALRRAEVRAAQAALAELEAGSRPEEIAQARANVKSAKADAVNARQLYERLKSASEISAGRAVRQQDVDAAKAGLEVTEAKLAVNERALDLVIAGPRKETIEQARARLQQSKEALALAETNLGYATIRSPLGGLVLSKNIEPGEYVAAGTPIVTVGDLESPWLRAYINETDLGRVKVGQQVRVTTDTYPGKIYEGRISFIASEAEFTPKNVQTERERVKLVYRIKVEIPNPNMELKPGMPADADILLDEAVMLSRGQHSN